MTSRERGGKRDQIREQQWRDGRTKKSREGRKYGRRVTRVERGEEGREGRVVEQRREGERFGSGDSQRW